MLYHLTDLNFVPYIGDLLLFSKCMRSEEWNFLVCVDATRLSRLNSSYPFATRRFLGIPLESYMNWHAFFASERAWWLNL